jgi:signal transduction histidine kinase
MARGYLLGIIVLFAKNKETFVKVDLSDLEKIGETIGIVSLFFKDIDLQIENQKQRAEISALGGMLKNLSHSLDHQEMLASLLAAAAKITKADMAALATYDKGENALIVHPTTHNIDKIKSTALKFGHDEKIGGATFCKGKIHVLNSLDDEHRNHFEKTELRNIRSLMAIPLKTRSQSVGVIYLLSERENNFRNPDYSILEKIASLISAALTHSEVIRVLSEEREKLAEVSTSLDKEKRQGSLLSRLEQGFSGLYGEQFKTPILGIKELLEMILAGEAGEIEKSSRRVIKEAKLATLRLANLVENIIYAQKLEKGKIALKPKKIDLNSLIEEVGNVYQKKIEEKGLILTNNIRGSLWVKCDPDKTRQIISNLFDNSIKFTRKGEIKISARGTDQFTEVKFNDTGIGIPTEHMKDLFSKFFRSQTPETQQITGSGLGLWVTKGLVEAQGGKISASSVRNQGSAFSFSLPKFM